ncbi:MAG: VOC family protein [Opitutaceae bacterium]|nr:VOC family protein [Opitutaceae bacterium]
MLSQRVVGWDRQPTTPMLRIKEIAYTAYPITDLARARHFYEGVLNLKVTTQFEHEGRHWVEYDVGPATLAISNMSADKWKPSADGPAVALEVEAFDAAITALRAASVTFLIDPMDTGVCRMAIIADPDGNSLVIHQRRAA